MKDCTSKTQKNKQTKKRHVGEESGHNVRPENRSELDQNLMDLDEINTNKKKMMPDVTVMVPRAEVFSKTTKYQTIRPMKNWKTIPNETRQDTERYQTKRFMIRIRLKRYETVRVCFKAIHS
jgi:hypothetical protein